MIAASDNPHPDPRSILLLRTSALGDVVHALPVLTALRRRFPRARIGWVVEEPFAPVVSGHPDLDVTIPVRLRAWRKRPLARSTWTEIGALRERLRDFEADVVLDLMGNHKAGVLGLLTGASRRVGAARAFRREPSSALWIGEQVPTEGPHAVDRMLSLLDALGVPREPADFGGDRLFAHSGGEMTETLASLPRRFALIHAGAGWANKRYPAERWGDVARLLLEKCGVPSRVALSPSAEEREFAARIVATSMGAAIEIPATSLAELAAITRRSTLVLGGDSGPTHLAVALGTPVVMVMGPTDPATHGPYAAVDHAIVERLPCSFCHKRFDQPKVCLLSIPPQRIVHRAAEILADLVET